MLVEKLSTAYKCHSSIGNSIDLKEMITEVIKTFVSESYAIYGEFYLINEDTCMDRIVKFGKLTSFQPSKYLEYKKSINLINDGEINVIKMILDHGIIFLVSKNKGADCSFFYSMFESLIPKLNLSINSCLNYDKLLVSYDLLKEQKKELIQANKTKDEFLANMSHELKTPLNSIMLISTIMIKNKEQKYDEKTIKNMNIIKKSSIDLMELINDILDISQIEARKIKIDNQIINLTEVIVELYDSMEEQAYSKNINFIQNFNGKKFTIYSDARRIKQIVKNLLSNAIKFTSNGSVTMDLNENIDSYDIVITDTGIGMEKNKLQQVFERFKQEDGTTTRKYGGTGLGLTISKELAILLGGDITVSSEKGIGSSFKFFIPKDKCMKIIKKDNEIIEESKDLILKRQFNDILICHSNNIEQFSLTIKLKKQNYNVISIIDKNNIEDFMDRCEDGFILILDENIESFNSIYEKLNNYKKKKLLMIVNDDKKSSYKADEYFIHNNEDSELIEKIEFLQKDKSYE